MAFQRDEESQKKGIVCMIMNFSSFKVSMDIYEAVNNLDLVLPHRIVGAHYCYTDPAMRPYVAGFQLLLHEKDRYRMRTHFGPRHEIDFELQTFGIPTKSCPISKDGTCCNQWHDQWLAMLRRQEEQDDDTDEDILVPRRFDVLLGKHSEAREHTGTLRALHVVEMYFEQYEKLGKYQKTEVAEKIISIIHESGGRFLKQTQYRSWNEVEDTEARKKIGHWFRHARTKRIRHPNTIPYTKEIPTSTNDWTANCPLKSATSTVKRAISACVPPIDEQH